MEDEKKSNSFTEDEKKSNSFTEDEKKSEVVQEQKSYPKIKLWGFAVRDFTKEAVLPRIPKVKIKIYW